jgi:cellulose synthase/poly-beta-1,6-N-acetylglucosamine synthase-like glycosyltransferase
VTRYCALELWQHQLITSAAKERLRLNPPAHGWFSCYRREALEQSGGFPQRSLGEDVEVTNALIAAGWQTRFVASSIVFGEVPRTISDYWTQHVRWARGLHDATPMRSLAKDTTVPRRIELWLHAAGYTDRLLVLAATSFAAVGRLTPWLPAGYVGLVAAEAVCALGRAGRLRSSPSFIAAAATMFAADVAASTSGTLLQLARRERSWRATARNGVDVGRTTASTD